VKKPRNLQPREPAPGPWENIDPMFDGHLQTPLHKMTVQQRLDWIDEMMRLRTEFRPADAPEYPKK
jgi:hypothetical protein